MLKEGSREFLRDENPDGKWIECLGLAVTEGKQIKDLEFLNRLGSNPAIEIRFQGIEIEPEQDSSGFKPGLIKGTRFPYRLKPIAAGAAG